MSPRAVRLALLLGHGVEIAQDGHEREPGDAERILLSIVVRKLGIPGILDAMREGAETIGELSDAIQMTDEDRVAIRAIALFLEAASAAIAAESGEHAPFAVGDLICADGTWSHAEPNALRVYAIRADGWLRVSPDGAPTYFVNPKAARKAKT